jgi:2-polyprenyl-6-methoxyphenol hydroxylase-like FAD-dependent oxidoreductase
MLPPHILIIGGGIGGLTLAQGLKKHNISFTLFERDPSPISRAQGYRLRLAGDGARGLRACLDDDLWSLFERTCAETKPGGFCMNAVDGTELPRLGPPRGPRGENLGPGSFGSIKPSEAIKPVYTVDRTMLRALLLLDQGGNVEFGKSFVKYEVTESGITAFFSDGCVADGTLPIGAEGVTSPVRKQLLPHHKYVDTETHVLYGKTPITPEFTERFAPEAMKGMTIIQDLSSLSLFVESIYFPSSASIESDGRIQSTQDYMYWVLGGGKDDMGLSDSQFHSLTGKGAAALALKLTEHWLPSFRCLFELQTTSQCAPLRLISAKPERPEWKPSAHVTLLGDAAHAMLPYGGSGANCALADAALLLKLIVNEGVSDEMMHKYVDEMWGYSLPAIERSAMGAQKLLRFKGWGDTKEVDV